MSSASAVVDRTTRTRTLSVDDNCCPVCHETIEIYAIGMCNHPICFRCSTRLRILCEQNDCAICRSNLKHVVFIKKKEKFEKIAVHSFCLSKDVMIFSESEEVKQKYQDLLKHKCKLCNKEEEFGSFTLLKNHMRDMHSLLSCQLCLEHLKLFSSERKFYTRQEMVQHKKFGDVNDKSYKGHPLCKFCDERYFDNDELNKHLRKAHFYCHICEENGVTGEYYCQYSDLHVHFREQHFVCEEGPCKDAQWSNVFRSQIDLNAHKLEQHSASMARSDRGQLRVINIDVNYHNPRQSAAAADVATNNLDRLRGLWLLVRRKLE
ncbi:hypothetical protein HELRODRAFT_85163 [Helobdella robusta]|uniref:RING-type domain-containing protein n=1 Tax=Helobdella robusta TaxID=6412 RepID=T1G5T6_HELRO|nr:hypothetical protein HELRODRAFT_85163 [Helobdella robusta]ESN97774.1 hypothetical protein HELRODRAFT_85163 [Helobdella robusta]